MSEYVCICGGRNGLHAIGCVAMESFVPASPPATGKSQSEWMELVGHPVPASPREIPVGSPTQRFQEWAEANDPANQSPAPAAPGVDAALHDFENAAISFGTGDGDMACVQRERERVRALIDAARQEERKKELDNSVRFALDFANRVTGLSRDYNTLLALVEEWQEARKEWEACKPGPFPWSSENKAKADRIDRAEAALAAWRGK